MGDDPIPHHFALVRYRPTGMAVSDVKSIRIGWPDRVEHALNALDESSFLARAVALTDSLRWLDHRWIRRFGSLRPSGGGGTGGVGPHPPPAADRRRALRL